MTHPKQNDIKGAMLKQVIIALFAVICFTLLSISEAQDELREMSSYKRFADAYEGGEGGQSLPALVRFGKRGPLPALVRFGKRSSMPALVRFGKRSSMPALVRFGKRAIEEQEEPLNWVLKFRR
uniref:Uncharacterized protein n=1 Tax=Acrobeloides nanus TaxID=290746 RepID=A0A914D3R9_9BILA